MRFETLDIIVGIGWWFALNYTDTVKLSDSEDSMEVQELKFFAAYESICIG